MLPRPAERPDPFALSASSALTHRALKKAQDRLSCLGRVPQRIRAPRSPLTLFPVPCKRTCREPISLFGPGFSNLRPNPRFSPNTREKCNEAPSPFPSSRRSCRTRRSPARRLALHEPHRRPRPHRHLPRHRLHRRRLARNHPRPLRHLRPLPLLLLLLPKKRSHRPEPERTAPRATHRLRGPKPPRPRNAGSVLPLLRPRARLPRR